MDWINLQQQLDKLPHLLPLQREWFSRVCFQLSFNQVDTIQTLGPDATAKTTLALALAELLSDQANVALLNATPEQQVLGSIQQQWFGRQATNIDLQQQVNLYAGHEPLCLIVDAADNYSPELIAEITSLQVLCFIFTSKSLVASALTLTLKTKAPAKQEQLLTRSALSTKQRKPASQQEHSSFDNLVKQAQQSSAQERKKSLWSKKLLIPLSMTLSVIIILMLAVVINYENMAPKPSDKAVAQAVPTKPVFALPRKTANSDDRLTIKDPASADMSESSVEATEPTAELRTAVGDNKAVTSASLNKQEQIPASELTAVDTAAERRDPASNKVSIAATTQVTADEAQALPPANASQAKAKPEPIDKCHSGQFASTRDSAVAIQLAVLSNVAAFEAFQSQYPSVAMQCYQRSWQGNLQIVVLLGPYAEKSEALMAKKALPAKLTKSGIFFKSLKAIKAEIDAFTVSQQLSTVD